MWVKDPTRWGVYTDCRHIPGGGIEDGETVEQALDREVLEEVWIDISSYPKEFTIPNTGTAEKILKDTGEKVLCHMEFNVFIVHLDAYAADVACKLSDDLVEVQRFDKDTLRDVKQIPGGKEFFEEIGLI